MTSGRSGGFRPHSRLQTGFTAGELSPSMYGRVDHEKYMLGLKRCENFFVRTHGGVSTRAGFEHIHVSYRNEKTRLVGFQLGTELSLLVEFGHEVTRFYYQGALALGGDPIASGTIAALSDNTFLFTPTVPVPITTLPEDMPFFEGDEMYCTTGGVASNGLVLDAAVLRYVGYQADNPVETVTEFVVNELAGIPWYMMELPPSLSVGDSFFFTGTIGAYSLVDVEFSLSVSGLKYGGVNAYTHIESLIGNPAHVDNDVIPITGGTAQRTEGAFKFRFASDYNYLVDASYPDNLVESESFAPQRVFHVATPYQVEELFQLKFVQSATDITVTHPSHAPRRISDLVAEVMEVILFAPKVAAPTDLNGVCNSKDGFNCRARYRITAVSDTTFEESTPAECSFQSHRNIGLPSLSVYTELTAYPHPLIENRISFTRNTDVLRYNVYRSMAGSAFTYVGSIAGDEDPVLSDDALIIKSITKSSHTVKRIRIKTESNHGLRSGDSVVIDGILGDEPTDDSLADVLNGGTFRVKKIDADEFYLRVLNANEYIEYPAGATEYAAPVIAGWVHSPDALTDAILQVSTSLNEVEGLDVGESLYIYGATGTHAGDVNDKVFIVASITTVGANYELTLTRNGTVLNTFGRTISGGYFSTAFCNDLGNRANFTDRLPMTATSLGVQDPPPPTAPMNPFNAAGNYPECAAFHEQRKWFGGSSNDPNRMWSSQIALYDNMNRKAPVAATDAVILSLPSTRVNPVYHILSSRDMIVFTGDGDWRIDSTDGAVSAATVRAQQQSYIGCARYVAPVPVAHRVLYAEDRGKGVRDLSYNDSSRGMQSIDRTVYARHLFDGKEITSMAYQSLPFSILWLTNDEGGLLAMSYEADQDVYAWSTHSRVGAQFQQVEMLREGNDDNIYALVKTTNDNPQYFIERLHNRRFTSLAESRCTDGWIQGEITMNGVGV